ncbi:ABC transporter substrate-binding protein [Paenibacillus agricola]|uniref:ABC transporter substrate-binding protein n=1 Tax=Paenibacillus agricola TaxID=2716264 RepID=A0ABX0J3J0_9BACL|nr:ABC transporter substrate-binding protein [Paenibacillus agricola]NHN29971.1 ABC transporter substrate-binding protein [Paenibacillus agricola]
MKKRVTGMVLATTMLSGLLAACSGGASQPQQNTGTQPKADEPKAATQPAAAPATSGGKITVQFWHSMGGKNGEYTDTLIKNFNASQDKIEVVGTFQGGYEETLTKLQQGVAAKTAPDISMVERGFIPLLADAEVLEDLNPYLKKSGMSTDDFTPGLMGNITFKNKLIALPFNRSTPLLHVNKTMLDEMGLAVPKNWEELRKVANALVIKENGATKRYGYSMPFASWYPIAMIVQSKGKFFNDQGTSIGFNNGEGVKAFKFLKEMQGTGGLYYPAAKDSGNIVGQMFISGQIGMLMESTGTIGKFIDGVKFNYETAFLPANDNYGAPTGGANIAMFSGSKNKEAAWEFIRWAVTDPKGAQQFIMSSGYLPFTKKMVESPEMKALWEKQPQRKVAYDQLQHAIDTNNHTQFASVDQAFFKVMEAIMYDNANIETQLEGFKKEAERIMKN